MPGRIRDQELGYCLGLCKVRTVKKFSVAVFKRLLPIKRPLNS